ncbi:hypothetical protein J6590_047639 [Homalodisca vitripennis]|nr:hypothetical protein J6590_047639 [Homalodisca vitripennis]
MTCTTLAGPAELSGEEPTTSSAYLPWPFCSRAAGCEGSPFQEHHHFHSHLVAWVHAEYVERWKLHTGLRMSRMVLQSPSPRVETNLLPLWSLLGLWVLLRHLKNHLHRVGILREDPLCKMCDKQEGTAEHLLFDCPARERYAICGSVDKGGEFPQEGLIGCFRRFVELLAGLMVYFRGAQKSLWPKCIVKGRPLEKKKNMC